jgi:hypothetical protein
MKVLLKIYSASCLIFAAFVLFFTIPLDSLGLLPSVMAMLFGGAILALLGLYVWSIHRREGLEFDWFLANRGGFWVICIGGFALSLFIAGILARIVPEAVVPAFERGAMPIAALFVVLFWLAIIYMFAFLTISMFGHSTANARKGLIKSSLGSLAIAAVCMGLAVLFFSLFTDVINDEFIRLTEATQRIAFWVFAAFLVGVGIIDGALNGHRYDETEE